MNFLKKLLSLFPEQKAYAHCDVPCGIYSPDAAKMAAKTILTMVQKIKALEPASKTPDAKLTYKNSLMRMIWTKEEHARICKHELLVLWADYFKPEHLSVFPDLHDVFWQAEKLCSKNKQNVDVATAEELVLALDKIAAMFEQAEKAKAKK